MGLFKKLASALKKTREAFARKFDAILSHGELDDDFYDELEELLISCDMGVKTSVEICENLSPNFSLPHQKLNFHIRQS